MAGEEGWTAHTLDRFCATNGISADVRRELWPDGVRSLGRDFNSVADGVTVSHGSDIGSTLSAILRRRFADNEKHKAAVGKLARSDVLAPFDTLRRTAQTAKLIWRMARGDDGQPAGPIRVGALTVLYSGCVLIWLGDRAPYRRLDRAVRWTAYLVGEP